MVEMVTSKNVFWMSPFPSNCSCESIWVSVSSVSPFLGLPAVLRCPCSAASINIFPSRRSARSLISAMAFLSALPTIHTEGKLISAAAFLMARISLKVSAFCNSCRARLINVSQSIDFLSFLLPASHDSAPQPQPSDTLQPTRRQSPPLWGRLGAYQLEGFVAFLF